MKAMLLRLDDELFKALEVKSSDSFRSREAFVRELVAAAVGTKSRIKPQQSNIWSQVRRKARMKRAVRK